MWYASKKRDTSTRRVSLGNLLVVGLPLLRARGLFTVSASLRKSCLILRVVAGMTSKLPSDSQGLKSVPCQGQIPWPQVLIVNSYNPQPRTSATKLHSYSLELSPVLSIFFSVACPLKIFFFNLYWRIVDLQGCVRCRCNM